MTDPESEVLSGKLLEEDSEISFAQLCEACEVHAESVEAMIEEGIIVPIGGGATHWRFTRISVVRVRSVLRMQRDLHVNLAGAALALDLLERIEALNDRVKALDPEHRR